MLNFSYGTGKIFAVPHEEVDGIWQGAVCELPLPAFSSGTMRGRFGPDGALYACGMFAWAGNATAPGGFHRIRSTGRPAHVPVAVHARRDTLEVVLSDPIDPASVTPEGCQLKTWSIKRSASYGSKHLGEKILAVSFAVCAGGRTITLTVPGLEPVDCYELILSAKDA